MNPEETPRMTKEERIALITKPRSTAKVRIIAGATGHDSIILVDDKFLACKSVTVKVAACDCTIATLEVYVDDLDVEFEGDLVFQRKEPDEDPDPSTGDSAG